MGTARETQLGARDRSDAERLRRVRELQRAVDTVVVGERERLVAELCRLHDELLRQGRAVEERVRRVAVQLDVVPRSGGGKAAASALWCGSVEPTPLAHRSRPLCEPAAALFVAEHHGVLSRLEDDLEVPA